MVSSHHNGLTGGLGKSPDPIISVVIAFLTLSFAYSMELHLQVWLRFNRYSGLYFWSLLVASAGVFLNSLGYLLKFFDLLPSPLFCLAISNVGWWGMVTGQSLVLYSRLHLVLHDKRRLKLVLVMIIGNAIVLHPTTTIVYFIVSLCFKSRWDSTHQSPSSRTRFLSPSISPRPASSRRSK
jgi:hypothetical protein